MWGVVFSQQTIGSDILDYGVIGYNGIWEVVLEWNGARYDSSHFHHSQEVEVVH